MTWFEQLTGFPESSPSQTQALLSFHGTRITSRVNGHSWSCGTFETPSLEELRARVLSGPPLLGSVCVREIVADVRTLHTDPNNAGALFQVASQFNCLEMVSPSVSPEEGVGIYQYDRTQGPACAIAAGAGTIYRNYFVPLSGQLGQSSALQLNCLEDVGNALGNDQGQLWRMQNGYVRPSLDGLRTISERLRAAPEAELDAIRKTLRVGLHWNTQVTQNGCQHLVSQAFCSALPVSYSEHPAHLWADFARLILEAAYEATFCAAVLNAQQHGNNRVFLTLLGGGAFGNAPHWILNALQRAVRCVQHVGLDVVIVRYGG